jgi:hypothetical protein
MQQKEYSFSAVRMFRNQFVSCSDMVFTGSFTSQYRPSEPHQTRGRNQQRGLRPAYQDNRSANCTFRDGPAVFNTPNPALDTVRHASPDGRK